MKYRIGLDIGVASVGWSALECDENGEPSRILDLGVRIFDGAENPKTGASLALPRREARSLRRRLRRRAHRLERVRMLCAQRFGNDVLKKAEENREDLFRLRFIGLSQPLKAEALTRILIYFAKHRGFQSNRRSEKKDKETGKLLDAVKENRTYRNDKGYRTIGEMIYRDPNYFDIINGRKVYKTRNGEKDYSKSFYRSDLKAEAELILEQQVDCGFIDEEFKQKYLEIFSSQRSFDEGPAKPSPYRIEEGYAVGTCPFENTEPRAPKASYTFEYCNALQKINNLKIIEKGQERFLSESERRQLQELAQTKKECNFAQVKKMFALSESASFNLVTYSVKKDGEGKTASEIEKKTKLFKMDKSYAIRSVLTEQNKKNEALLDKIAEILSLYKSDERRKNAFTESAECKILSEKEKDDLLELDFSTFGGLSLKAMRKLIPFLESGLKYDKACEAAGYNFRAHAESTEKLKKLKGDEIRTKIEDIAVPVVRRSVSQSVKVLNNIIDKYGSPCAVNVELARELSKNFDERNKIKKDNLNNEAEYQKNIEKLRNEYHVYNPKGVDVLKLRLYEEQGGKCAYSGKTIDTNRLFESNYTQIDHIIPYSRSFDDSYSNKALVLTAENQNKGNQTPYEYLGNNAARWTEFESFVQATYSRVSDRKKRENLLRSSFTEENAKDWKERSLNDTKYISRFMYNLINDYLYLEPIAGKKKQVFAVNGRITSYLRKFWGLKKEREAGDKHHALDACVIASVTDGIIQKVTKFNQLKERCAHWDREQKKYVFADGDGIILTEDEYDERYGYKNKPYDGFREELLFRLMDNPQDFKEPHRMLLQSLDYSDEEIDGISPVFVSRMPKRKADGPIHAETIRSARSLSQGVSASKTPLTELKLTKDKSAIEGYDEKAKRDDKLLYDALYTRLLAFDGNAEEAFAEPFYKPAQAGKQGNPVKKVWINNVFNTGVRLEKRKGVADNAANGGMVRIDVFSKNGQYYCVPVYIKDIYARRLPDRAISSGKTCEDWTKTDESFTFLFALFPNDLIYVKARKQFNLKPSDKQEKQTTAVSEGFFYYKGIDSNTGRANIITHDNSYEGRLGLKTLLKLEKYTVDVLGEKHPVKQEKRLNTEWDS